MANGPFIRVVAVAGVLSAMTSVGAQTPPAGSGAEQGSGTDTRLEALRNAMIDQALESPVHITSNAWLDESGRLRHVSRFFSEVRARAAADLIVSSESAAEARATAAVAGSARTVSQASAGAAPTPGSSVPTGPDPSAVSDGQLSSPMPPSGDIVARNERIECRPDRSGLVRAAIVRTDLVPADGARGHSVLNDLQAVIQNALIRQSGQGGLTVVGVDPSRQDRYSRLISSTGLQEAPYRIDVRLSSDRVSVEPNSRGALPGQSILSLGLVAARRTFSELEQPAALLPERRVDIELALVEAPSERTVLRHRLPAVIPAVSPSHNTPILLDSTLAETQMAVLAWWSDAVNTLRCEPLRVQANLLGAGALSIPMGGNSGVRVGDRWMIADTAKIPARVLESGSVDRIMMAEVISVGHHRSTLRLTAESAASSVRPGLERGVPWFASPL